LIKVLIGCYTLIKEKSMPQTQTMTLDEKLAISCKAAELRKAGDREGASRLLRTAPLPPYLAKVMKEKVGADFLIDAGYNLSEAEAEFGKDWLTT
jgi:hypothetical protein